MRNRLLTFGLLLFLVFNCDNQHDYISFQQIVYTQIERYPQMQIEDLYKLVHQAALGNIHLGVDTSTIRNYLLNEMEKIEASEKGELVEDISQDGLVRVNLRPFKAKNGNPGKLLEAMVKTAQTFQPDKEKIIQYWKVIVNMAEENSIPFNKSQLESFFKKMQAADFPAIHHSEEYSEMYRPAYRVILKAYLPAIR
jgi:hypothetical protein